MPTSEAEFQRISTEFAEFVEQAKARGLTPPQIMATPEADRLIATMMRALIDHETVQVRAERDTALRERDEAREEMGKLRADTDAAFKQVFAERDAAMAEAKRLREWRAAVLDLAEASPLAQIAHVFKVAFGRN